MRSAAAIIPILVLLATAVWCGADSGVVGKWSFEDSLRNAAGPAGDIAGEDVKYAEGVRGKALSLDWYRVAIPDSAAVRLTPGLTIDCWVYFDTKPTGYQHIVYKDKEYQLRIDGEGEGGQFALFVYLDGWEPRIRGPVPQADTWYHIVARWTGNELSLEVNGERYSRPRSGITAPTENPVNIGAISGRIDELRLSNPGFLTRQRIAERLEAIGDEDRFAGDEFGADAGWPGWETMGGATAEEHDGGREIIFDGPTAMFCNPRLDLDVTGRRYVCIDMGSETSQHATLTYITEQGSGTVSFAFWDTDRTTILDLGMSPQWVGRLKFLGLGFGDEGRHTAQVKKVYISAEPRGQPLVYVRSVAPHRAILRCGRDETIVAVVRGLGRGVEDVQARLALPEGVTALDESVKEIDRVRYHGTVRLTWQVRAAEPVSGRATVTVSAPGMEARQAGTDLAFKPPCDLPKASYVPEPEPATSPYTLLMHYCPLWKLGTHYGWDKIENWPERRPAIGWYDEGTPEVADWHIKYALEHGIQAFIYCWYRSNWGPDVKHNLGHAIHDGLMNARYRDMFDFCIMWENGCAKGVQSVEDMMDNLLPYWMENYFTHPSYLVIDNKPVLFVWRPERVAGEVGGSENVRRMLDGMREECRKRGFDGLYIIGCVGGAQEALLHRMAKEGWDYSSAYGLSGGTAEPTRDIEGITCTPHDVWIKGQRETLLKKKEIGAIPDIVDVMCGWDPRPWHGMHTSGYRADPTVEAFKAACMNAKEIVDATPGNGLDSRLVVFDNWDEFGEGHYIEPCAGPGFGYVDAIKEVFCDPGQPCNHIIPEDVGLEPPEHVYEKYKQTLEPEEETAQREVVGNLVAWWRFDEDDETMALDSSNCGFHAFKREYESAAGISGKGFLCDGGSVSVGRHEEFWPPTGITVELWFKTDVPDQSDTWMVNTISRSNTGYRLGMSKGRICWQIPLTEWSHLLACPEPAELGQWTHVAATHDNEMMRIFVNGQLEAEMKRSGKIMPSEGPLHIGTYSAGHGSAFFRGILDEVRIYDRPLSADEIREHYREFTGGKRSTANERE